MDYSIADYAGQMNPLQQQMLMANMLKQRGRLEGQDKLAAEVKNAQRFNEIAAVTHLINNPAAVKATSAAQESAMAGGPQRLGQQGYMLPSSGEFVESPIYADEKQAQRDAMLEGRRASADAAMERAREGNLLKSSMAELYERGRSERAEEGRLLRASIAEMQERGRNERAGDKAAKGKTLPATNVTKLQEQEGIAYNFGNIAENFKDDYSTAGATGLQNALGKYQPLGIGAKYGAQSNWWQNYNEQKNQIRNKLFGSALTATEKAAFDAANIEEGMDPQMIRTRLNQQHAASVRAYNKLKAAYDKAGYDMGGFDDMMEPPKLMPGTGKTPAAGAPKRIKYDANGEEVPQ